MSTRAPTPRRYCSRAPLGVSGESGAVAIMVGLVMTVVLLATTVIMLVVGQLARTGREMQSAADAVALAAAYSLQQHGLPYRPDLAVPLAPRNVTLGVAPRVFSPVHRPDENRSIVGVELTGLFDSEQAFFGPLLRLWTVRKRAYAQVWEDVFGDRWPALTLIVDGSDFMNQPSLGNPSLRAWDVLRQVIDNYATQTLPVRNGLVVFNDNAVVNLAPPTDRRYNIATIRTQLNTVVPHGLSNIRAGIDAAASHLRSVRYGRNVVLISDGEATRGGGCAPRQPCHFEAARQAGTRLRYLGGPSGPTGVNLFTVETRRHNFTPQAARLLEQLAGAPLTPGNNGTMRQLVQGIVGINAFLTRLTRLICTFGPLDPAPGEHPVRDERNRRLDPPVLRPVRGDLLAPQRVYAFVRHPNGAEIYIPRVENRDDLPRNAGFEYLSSPAGSFVVLTQASCNQLGADPRRRLVVRWDDAQLVDAI